MSERGSFVTEYIYCRACFAAAQSVLLAERGKYLCASILPSWSESGQPPLPIIAGKIGGFYPGEEAATFDDELIPLLKELLCHEMRIAVIPEAASARVFTVVPEKTGV